MSKRYHLAIAVLLSVLVTPCASSAATLCNVEITAPADTVARLRAKPGAKILQDDGQYLAISVADTGAVFTLTKPGHPAHPAIVCRMVIPAEGRQFRVGMQSACGGPKPACEALMAAFQRQINQQ